MDFIARVNEEDHLTLTVSRPGARVQEAFAGLCRGHTILETALSQQGRSFMHSDRLGFLTSCPSNLGSAMRIVISVKFPLLSARPDFREICRALRLMIRPSDALGPGIWEVSNAEGLGTSEAALVSCVVRGCCHLVEMEEALTRGLAVCRPGLGAAPLPGFFAEHSPTALPDLSGHTSVLAEVLRKEPSLYSRLRDRRTRGGISFAQVIKAGVDTKEAALGLAAGDAECYEAFSAVFDPCIEVFHGMLPTAPHPRGLDPFAVTGSAVVADPRILAVRLRVARNLAGVPLSPACSMDARRGVEQAVVGALSELTGTLEGEYFPLTSSSSYGLKPCGMGQDDAKELKADGILFQEPKAPELLAAGVGRDWPDARGVFTSKDHRFAAWVNEEEHLSLIVSRQDGNLKDAFACLCSVEKALSHSLQQEGHAFSCSERLGFLMAMPERLGTGFSVSVTLRLPKLAVSANLSSLCLSHGLRLISATRDGVVKVENRSTFGVSEAGLVSAMTDACKTLLASEA